MMIFKYLIRVMLALTVFIQAANFTRVESAFEDFGVGARAPGMADTHVAIADDANALWYNPAGLVQLSESEITTQYGQVLRGLDDGSNLGTTYLGFAHPYRRGLKSIGAAYQNFKADNLFNERTLVLSYGQRLKIEPFGWKGNWFGGVNLKQLNLQYQPDRFTENALNDAGTASNRTDPLFGSGYSKSAYAADLSALYQFGQGNRYSAGLMLTNINRPNVSLNGGNNKVPSSTKLGAAYKPKWGVVSSEVRKTKRLASKTDTDFSFGAERFMKTGTMSGLILRAGYADGSRGFKALTAGLGYAYSRFRFDYAFNFPINNLSDSSGAHRLGFSFKLGEPAKTAKAKEYSEINLLSAFDWDSSTAYVLINLFAKDHRLSVADKDLLLLLLMRKHPLDDVGLEDARDDLRNILRNKTSDERDWTQVKHEFLRGLNNDDRTHVSQALELLVKGESKSALNRMALLSESAQDNNRLGGLSIIALGELAAQKYRDEKIEDCIDRVRQLVDKMPTEDVVMRAYRKLLTMRRRPTPVDDTVVEEDTTTPEEIPEAPQALVAPTNPEKAFTGKLMGEKDAISRSFASSLGYYFMRKSEGANKDERLFLLNQMKAVYEPAGMDMTLVNKEFVSLKVTPKDNPTRVAPTKTTEPVIERTGEKAKPVSPKLTPKAKPVITVKPAPAPVRSISDPELDRAWEYYRKAAAREITDHEKVEILESMLIKFGEKGAEKINKELQRIRKRLE